MRNTHQRKNETQKTLGLIALSLLLHVLGILLVTPYWDGLTQVSHLPSANIPVTMLIETPEKEPPEILPPLPVGQIVDVAQPEHSEKPPEADYLAERDQTVEQETMTDQYRVNPEVLAEEYSTDDQLQFEDGHSQEKRLVINVIKDTLREDV